LRRALLADRRPQQPAPSASPAAPFPQATVLIDLAAILAVGAFRVGWMQAMGANRVLNVELAHVGMDDHETLIDQQ
jgi:hypothetical protein